MRSSIKIIASCFIVVTLLTLHGCNDDEKNSMPVIVSFSPGEGEVGETVTITGRNFGSPASKNIVRFNNTATTVLTGTSTSLVVTVPRGATTGPMVVTVAEVGTAVSSQNFTVTCLDCGVIENFSLKNSSRFIVEPINSQKMSYDNRFGTRRGVTFSVEKTIRLTAIGGLFRKQGDFVVELISSGTPIYTATVTVTDTENFTFKEVNTDVQLSPGNFYLFRYCDVDHDSIYDIWFLNPASEPQLLQPQDLGDVRLEAIYYNYLQDCSATSYSGNYFHHSGLLMRGIVDFKYEIIE
jgi:hypothetical protein